VSRSQRRSCNILETLPFYLVVLFFLSRGCPHHFCLSVRPVALPYCVN